MSPRLTYLLKVMRHRGLKPSSIEAIDLAARTQAMIEFFKHLEPPAPNVAMIHRRDIDKAMSAFLAHGRIFEEDGE